MDLREIRLEYGLDSYGSSGQRSVAGSYEHGNEP
jgi:hypothetical protein